jgi:D-alanyl-D-alanine carboxypeptidase/D-alanyl-D-alanine-endopeptidase (penicillin-binding protein 4)
LAYHKPVPLFSTSHRSVFSAFQYAIMSSPWLALLLLCGLSSQPLWASAPSGAIEVPTAVWQSLAKNQIPRDAVSISVLELPSTPGANAREVLDWRAKQSMNPASAIKLLTTLAALDLLGPQYRWNTNLYTDGQIKNGLLKGNLYLRGSGDPKLIPEELAQMMKSLRDLGVQRIDGNLIFDRSAYSPEVMEHATIDGESMRSYNVPPDPLLYAFRTLSFQVSQAREDNPIAISYTPALTQFKVVNQLRPSNQGCDAWRKQIQFELVKQLGSSPSKSDQWQALFNGEFPSACKNIAYNVVALDPNTFLTLGFAAAWELAGGTWAKQPQGKSGEVPLFARPLLEFQGGPLIHAVNDINKFSNNVMARQVFLTLSLERLGKPANIGASDRVMQAWLKQRGLHFPELVLENGSGLSRNEAISARHLNDLLITARQLPSGDLFVQSLPLAGSDGTMKNRLIRQLRQFLHLKTKPEARIKTGSLAEVRAISGYVISQSGKTYAVSSFINHPNAFRGLDAHDQLLTWLLTGGPEPKQAR